MEAPEPYIRHLEEENAKLRRRVNLLEQRIAVYQSVTERITEITQRHRKTAPHDEAPIKEPEA